MRRRRYETARSCPDSWPWSLARSQQSGREKVHAFPRIRPYDSRNVIGHPSSTLLPLERSEIIAWLRDHVFVAIAVAAFCIWVSGAIIIRIWTVHRRASVLKKAIWTIVALIPLFGWIFYGGLFRVPPPHGEGIESTWSPI